MSDEPLMPDSGLPAEFRSIVSEELQALGFSIVSWDGDGLECLDPEGEQRSLGLNNLLRRVRGASPAEARESIRSFLAVLRHTEQIGDEMPNDLAEVTDRLLPRLGRAFPEGTVAPWSQELIGTDLVVNLVIDHDDYMRYVPTELMERSSRTPEEWVSISFQNLKERTPDDWLTVVHEETGILCGHCNDSYDACRAIILHQLVETSPLGWMLCIPTRDLVFALPVHPDHLSSFHLLKVLAENHFKEDPYPITDHVYWVRGLVWEEFAMDVDDDGARIYPPDEFIELLGLEDQVNPATEEEFSDEFPDDDDEDLPEEESSPERK